MAENKRVNYELRAEDGFTAVFDKLHGKITDTESHFKNLKGVVAGMFAGFSIAGLGALVKSVIDAGDEAYKMAQKVGIGVEAWQQLVYAGRLAGAEQEVLAKGIKGLSQNMLEAAKGGDQASAMFNRFGISVKDVGGVLRPTEQVLLDIAGKFSKMRDGAEKTAIATQLFGKAGMELIPFLNQGRDGIEALMKEADRLGIVMDKNTAAAAEALNDNFTRLSSATRGLIVQGVAPLIPFMEKMSESMVKSRTEGDRLASGAKILETGLKLVGSVAIIVKGTFEALGQLMGGIAAAWVAWVNLRPGDSMKILKQTFADVASIADRNKQLLSDLWNGTTAGANRAAAATGALGGQITKVVKAENELDELLAKISAKDSGFKPDFTKNVVVLTQALVTGQLSLKAYAGAYQALISQQPVVDQFFKNEEEQQKHLNELRQQANELLLEEVNARNSMINGLADQLRTLEIENRYMGDSNSARAIALLQIQRERDLKLALTDADEALVNKMYDEIAAQLKLREATENQLSMWRDIADRGSRFFEDLVTNGRSAFGRLRDELKRFGAELLAMFAKRWILQLGASLIGGTSGQALAGAAGQVGQGTLTGAVGNWLGSTALGTAFSGAAEGFQMGFMSGMASPTAGLAEQFGASLSNALPVLGYFAIALAGAAIAAHQFAAGWRINNPATGQDFRTNNPASPLFTASAMDRTYRALGFNDQWAAILSGSSLAVRLFGRRARQNDAFGLNGSVNGGAITAENWQDWSEQGGLFSSTRRGTDITALSADQRTFMAAMMAPINQIVATLGARYGVDASSTLAGYNKPFNFQLNENGKPLNDEELSKLFGDFFTGVLRDQVETMFRAGGKGALADYVRDLKGTSDEVTASITELIGAISGLQQLGAKGLDVEALMAWQREGESLGQAFARVVQQFVQFDDAFLTEVDKLDNAQGLVSKAFAEIGITVPESTRAFYDLVHGLDLSTEAGRKTFDSLMQVAPAFLQVQNAAASMLSNFDSIMGNLRVGYTQQVQQMQLDTALGEFQSSHGWASRLDLPGLLGQILTIQREDFQRYSLKDQETITRILGLYGQLNGSSGPQGAIAQSVGVVADPLRDLVLAMHEAQGALSSLASATSDARGGIAAWLSKTLLSSDLSTLSPFEKFDLSQRQYVENLMKAQGNDLGALQGYTGFAQDYLQQALSYLGPTPAYQQILAGVAGQAGSLAGLADAVRPLSAGDYRAGNAELIKAVRDLQASVGLLQPALARQGATIAVAVVEGGKQTRQAIEDMSNTY